MELALLEQSQIVDARQAAVDHHGCALGQADPLGQPVEHGGERRAVLGIAGKHFMTDRKAFAPHRQADDDLLAVGPAVARIAAPGLGIGHGQAFEIGRGEVVEIDGGIKVEEAALALNQGGLDRCAMPVQDIENAVELVLGQIVEVGGQDVGQRRAPNPSRHGMLGGGRDQPVQGHGAGELARRKGQAEVLQDRLQAQTPPELVSDMHGAGFAMALGGDPARVERDIDRSGGQRLRVRRGSAASDGG